ncbi:MAG: hypothetical protein GY946_12055, partial [bacterium]|nr:hypothetical protein [bacterium]
MSLEVSIGRAHEFVAKQGSRTDILFLEALLRERPVEEFLTSLEQLQDVRGAIAAMDESGEEAGLASTARAFGRLLSLGFGDHPVTERACAFLCRLQAADGAWALTRDADPLERIRWTGAIGGFLAGTPFARSSVLAAAEEFMAERWSVDLVKGSNYDPILAYTGLLTQVPSELADTALQWCGRELEQGFRNQVFSPLATVRVFLRAGVPALPG